MSYAYKVKITVLKRLSTADIHGNDLPDEVTADFARLCPRVEEGQVFIVEPNGGMPAGFCSWAWADIQRDVTVLRFGSHFPFMKQDTAYSSCTDGLRTVFFKLERMEGGDY